MSQRLHYEFGNLSDVGCVRTENEDSYVLYRAADRKQTERRGHLVLVCDGMGGARGGRIASNTAVETISRTYYLSPNDDPRTAITAAFKEANQQIHKQSQQTETLKGMGTTAVAALLFADHAYVAHVGDSRCYLIRDHEITQLTEDHTMVQKMVRQGMITADEARSHPEGHILSRSIGVNDHVEVDLTMEPIQLQSNDILVLCSDGLSGQVLDDEILQIVDKNQAQHAAEKLVELAKERGGPDNITVQIVRAHAEELDDEAGTTTIRTAPLRPGAPWLLIISLLLLLIAATLTGLWYFDVVDYGELLRQIGIGAGSG